jgi:hypothetical protein
MLTQITPVFRVYVIWFDKPVVLDSLFTIKIGQAMTDKIRKNRTEFTPDQRLEYAKLMVGG